jgi:stage II sporulation protein AA (anti-sigma F factor antagonist)
MPLPPDHPLLEEIPGEAVVRLNVANLGETDLEHVRAPLFQLAARRRGQHLCLDLGRLNYISSSGLGLLLALYGHVRMAGGRLSLCNVRETVYEVFAVTRLNSILDVRRQTTAGEPPASA